MLSGEGNTGEPRENVNGPMTRTHSTHALNFGRENYRLPRGGLAGKNCWQITTRFRFLVYSGLFFSSLKYNEHAVKGEKKHLVYRGGKMVFVIM